MMKKLARSVSDKRIFGVCGGLGDFFGIDALLFRCAFILLAFTGTIGIWLYLGFALALPVSEYLTDGYDAGYIEKSATDRKLFGVCGGLAEYFDADVTGIRLTFVFASLFFGYGLLAYIILAIAMPREKM